MAELRLYRTYRFIDKDPVIDKMRTVLQKEGLIKRLGIVHQLSGVSTSTLDNWFNGDTKCPQNYTVQAVMTSLGYEQRFVRDGEIDVEKELKKANEWKLRQERKEVKRKPSNRRHTNGHQLRA